MQTAKKYRDIAGSVQGVIQDFEVGGGGGIRWGAKHIAVWGHAPPTQNFGGN